jgi:iron complex outermembrane receptor protein
MARDPSRLWRPLVVTAALSPLAIAVSAWGQQSDEDQTVTSSRVEAAAAGDTSNETEGRSSPVEEVVVTGSRIKRDTYSSISPLQIISMEFSKEAGLIDAGEILQSSTTTQGQQIDLTFNGFVLDNGPGATTVNLRGLGPQRTLLLLNGRRMAPSGVEGAPQAPNVNLIPRTMVQQYDNLLDGASSVYGSDAIAGVINVVTRKDFDGFQIEYFGQRPQEDGGDEHTVSFNWGTSTDRGTFGIGAEIIDRNNTQFKDRPWLNGCESHREVTEDGQIRTTDQFYESIGYQSLGDCRLGSLVGRTIIDGSPFGSIYYTPGQSNGGWGNWSESGDPYTGLAADGNGDGIGDVNFREFDLNGAQLDRDFLPKTRNINAMAYGEYTFEGEANFTPYFEVLYNSQETDQFGQEGQLFPFVPANNPFNLCNPNQPNGVDCGLAIGEYLDNPSIAQGIANEFGLTPAQFRDLGIVNLYPGAIGPVRTRPIVSVRGDRNNFAVDLQQIRGVLGFRTDLPMINFGDVTNWSAEAYVSYSRSDGESVRRGVREDRIDLALGAYSTTNTPCENDVGADLRADAVAGCVPVNMYAPSLYDVSNGAGDFATQAERDFLFDDRIMDTVYEQIVVNAFATGDLMQLPAGTMSGAFGLEYRYDDLNSSPNDVAGQGLLWGFFSDLGGVGDRTTKEVFAEVDIPLLANLPLATELTMNLSARFTDDEFYGNNTTESAKIGWRPTEEMLIRATWGTAFRAPNLRELFLGGSTGFTNVADPCYIPEAAIDALTGGYNPENDQREPQVFGNCAAQGVDATLANNDGFNTFSVEVAQGGSLELDPEESESWTLGFAYEQPFFNDFDLRFGMTYYEIEVTNTVIAPSAGFIVADCLLDESGNGQSAFCSRITRDLSDPTDPRITNIGLGFINRDQEVARGIDYNLTFEDQFSIGKTPVDFGFDITANRTLERSTLFTNADGSVDQEDFTGEFGFPDYNVILTARFEWDRWGATWQTQYLSSVEQDRDEVDPFDNVSGASDTCGLNGEAVLCRDVGFADSWQVSTASVRYNADNWILSAGVRNVFNEQPPKVDGSEVLSINNLPIGVGYFQGLVGRNFFINASYSFGGTGS